MKPSRFSSAGNRFFLNRRPLAGRAGIAVAVILFFAASESRGAVIELHDEFRSDGGLVLLGDIAQITANDPGEAKRLAALDVIAAPPAGRRRYLRARELQDILVSRGVNWSEHRLSGASQITILGALDPALHAASGDGAPGAAARLTSHQAADQVRAALLAYVQEGLDRDDAYQIKFEINSRQAQFVAESGQQLVVSGGKPPWTGMQVFQLTATADGKTRQTTVRAEVSAPPTLVVATRSLPHGAIIREGDVRLQAGQMPKGDVHPYETLEEVIGKELPRGAVEGQILDDQSARSPLLVRRGEMVTVFARCGGVQVRTTARAKEDGSHNDLVSVESLADRQPYFTRVIGMQEVEVYAHAVIAAGELAESREKAKTSLTLAPPEAPLPARAGALAPDPRTTQRVASAPAKVAARPARTAASTPAPGSILAHAPLASPNTAIKSVVVRKERQKQPSEPDGGASDQ